jgi:hypothetical protein
MAYLPGSARLVFGGALFDHTEQWSCSLGVHRWSGSTNLVRPDVVSPIIENWFAGSTMRISGAATLDYLKLNEIDTEGHYLDKSNTNAKTWAVPFPKGGIDRTAVGGTVFPQLTVAVSLVTAAQRGYASKGRFFLPVPAIDADQNGRIPGPTAQAMATATASMISSLNRVLSSDGSGWQISVLSSHGAARHVTGVRIGNVMDTQRRRRESWPEVYFPAAVTDSQLDPGQAVPVGGGVGGSV